MDTTAKSVSWLRRHRAPVTVGGILFLVLLVAQSPMLRAMGSRLLGRTPPDDGIPWRSDFATASAESKQTGKPILLRFSAVWCPPCQAMSDDSWPDPAVRQTVIERYIPVMVDVDLPANEQLSQRYDVGTIPTIVIVDTQGQVIKRGQYMAAGTLRNFLLSVPVVGLQTPGID